MPDEPLKRKFFDRAVGQRLVARAFHLAERLGRDHHALPP